MSKLDKSFLQQEIADGNTAEAIKRLNASIADIQSTALRQEILHLSSRWHDYERALRMRTTSQEELDLTKRQINHSLLALLEKIEPDAFKSLKRSPKQQKWRNFFVIAAGIIGALAGIAEITGKNISNLFAEEATVTPIVDTQTVPITLVDTIPQEEPSTKDKPQKQPTISTPPNPKLENEIQEVKPPPKETPKTEALKISCSTNKGTHNLRFQKGDTVAFHYQVNQVCYIRVIGKLADGRIVLLYDDQRIEQADINKQLQLAKFEVDDPLGKEELYFFAQKKKFPTLTTSYSDDGYDVITSGLPKALKKTRGFKVVNEYAEARLEVETYQ
ncbi:MAG: DUF4384 domain-containing protein [Bacteroidota bacterium]